MNFVSQTSAIGNFASYPFGGSGGRGDITFTISAFPSPQAAKTAHLQLFTTGIVIVTLDGGGFGESVIGAIIEVLSWNKKQVYI